jgi:lactate permease
MYTQVFDPMGSLTLSAFIAFIPIVFFFVVLVVLKVKGYWAGLMTAVLAIILAVLVYHMPVDLAVVSAIHGFVYGFFPIGWIVLAATFLYNLTVETGQFEVIKKSISSITDDRRLQVLLICFCFGAFLEGAAGFGTPVAITAAMLVGLGFPGSVCGLSCFIGQYGACSFWRTGDSRIGGGTGYRVGWEYDC